MLFSKEETPRKSKREPTTPTKSGAQNAWAGATARGGKSGVSSSSRKREGGGDRELRRAKTTRSLFRTAAKPNWGETLESSSAPSVELVSDRDVRASFHGRTKRPILVTLFITRQPRENVEPAEKEDDGTREAKRNQAAGTNNSRAQKQDLPRKRSKAS